MINNVIKTKIYFENIIDLTKLLKYIEENKNNQLKNKQLVIQLEINNELNNIINY